MKNKAMVITLLSILFLFVIGFIYALYSSGANIVIIIAIVFLIVLFLYLGLL